MSNRTRSRTGTALGLLLALALGACTRSPAPQATVDLTPTTGPVAPPPVQGPYLQLEALLQRHVQGDQVDYAGLREEVQLLDDCLEALGRVNPSSLTREEQLAFWINAYNACTLKLIVQQSPELVSIVDIPAGKRWKWKGWQMGGGTVSLDQMEHDILRPLGEPRIHFAINCASRSCPRLSPRAYRGGQLEAQLEEATRGYLADSSHGLRLETPAGKPPELHLSRIFEWFGEDFEKSADSVGTFVRRHAPEQVQAALSAHPGPLRIRYLEYDWSLNGR